MSDSWKQWEGHVIDGRFTLKEFQGRSDHSAVFQTSYGPYAQAAALKLVEATPATDNVQLARWERAAKLQHPHLLRVYHWGRCQLGKLPMLYVVTELADENLAQILPNRALTPSETEYMLRSLLEVLGYLHGAGYAHGHLKPGNIMAVGEDLRLSGDTICQAGEKDSAPRSPSVYDAPEITTSGITPAGDIWSLGITLVEGLTQRASPADAVRLMDPALPETLPAPFLDIARQCLRLDPERRWSVSDIAARLLPPAAAPKKPSRAGYLVASVVLVCLAGLVAVPKLMHRGSLKTTAEAPAPNKQPSPSPAPTLSAGNPDEGKHELPMPERKKPVQPPREATPSPDTMPVSAAGQQATPRTDLPATAPSQGAVVERVLPKVSQRSLNTITGKVRVTVRVSVDASGKVSNASLASAGPSEYFSKVALEASRHWKFTPAQSDAAPGQWLLHYAFARKGVEVQAAPVSR